MFFEDFTDRSAGRYPAEWSALALSPDVGWGQLPPCGARGWLGVRVLD